MLRAYPEAHVTLVDMDSGRTNIAVGLARQMGLGEQVHRPNLKFTGLTQNLGQL
jgi:hypothetical protein